MTRGVFFSWLIVTGGVIILDESIKRAGYFKSELGWIAKYVTEAGGFAKYCIKKKQHHKQASKQTSKLRHFNMFFELPFAILLFLSKEQGFKI